MLWDTQLAREDRTLLDATPMPLSRGASRHGLTISLRILWKVNLRNAARKAAAVRTEYAAPSTGTFGLNLGSADVKAQDRDGWEANSQKGDKPALNIVAEQEPRDADASAKALSIVQADRLLSRASTKPVVVRDWRKAETYARC